MKKFIILTFVFACVFFSLHMKVLACVCVDLGESLEEKIKWQMKNDKAIFVGKLIEIGNNSENGDRLLKFQVEQFWKGELTEEITIATENERNSCAQPFEKGKDYLIFVATFNNKLNTGGCLPNREINKAADELKILGKGRKPTKSKS